MTTPSVRRVVFASALYDLLVTVLFATPWTARALLTALAGLHTALQLPGLTPAPPDALALMFANLMGSLVVVWSVVRLRAPSAQLGLADVAGRALFAAWQLHALLQGVSWVLVPILLGELVWGLAQLAVVAPALWPTRVRT